MFKIFLAAVLIIASAKDTFSKEINRQISHVFFVNDKLVYLIQQAHTVKAFGFLNRFTGEIMTEHNIQKDEIVLNVDKFHEKFFIREEKNKILIFKMKNFSLEQKIFKIKSNSQILDIIEEQNGYFLLTNVDVRFYPLDSKPQAENIKDILFNKGSAGLSFHKLIHFPNKNGNKRIVLIYTMNSAKQLCFRSFNQTSLNLYNICFKISNLNIKNIQKTGNFIVIQSISKVYSIGIDLDTLGSVDGFPIQYSHGKAILRDGIQTYDFQSRQINPKIVILSRKNLFQSSIKLQNDDYQITIGDKMFEKIERPSKNYKILRSWIEPLNQNLQTLIIQWENSLLYSYEIEMTSSFGHQNHLLLSKWKKQFNKAKISSSQEEEL